MYDTNGNDVTPVDTEDKAAWIQSGTLGEQDFLTLCRAESILPEIADNPIRQGGQNMSRPEFIYGGHLLDVKAQAMPLFTAANKYGIPSRYAVTLNVNDVADIRNKYPDCRVAFWVNWRAVQCVYHLSNGETRQSRRVVPLHGVWLVAPEDLYALTEEARREGRILTYKRRIGDKVNAVESYVLDVRQMNLIWLDSASQPIEPL